MKIKMKELPLGDACKFASGGTPSKSNAEFWIGECPWLSAKDLKTFFLKDSIDHVSESAIGNGTRLAPLGSTIVLVRGMTLLKNFPVGFACRPMAFNQDLKALIPKENTDPLFLSYALASSAHSIKRYVDRSGHGTGRLSTEFLRDYPIAHPPLPEQRKIAETLGDWDRALETLDALIATQQQRKRALIQQVLSGQRRLPGFTKPWQEVRLSKVLKHVFRPIEWREDLDLVLVSIRRRGGGMFKRPAIKAAQYNTRDLHEIHTHDLLISKRQVTHGAVSLVTEEFNRSHVSKEYTIYENKAPEALHMPFIGWLAQTKLFWHKAYVASNGVVIEKLIFVPNDFLKFSFPMPTRVPEQRAIAEVLDAADAELRVLHAQRTALERQKRGLMQQLLTGKIRVSV